MLQLLPRHLQLIIIFAAQKKSEVIRVINHPPQFVRNLMPNFKWKVDSAENTLFLTFDDGPTPNVTEWVLDNLAEYDAKATFFCLGRNAEHYPDIYKRIIDEGHAVGNHTYSHLNGWKVSVQEYIDDVDLASQIIDSHLMRPPYGRFTKKQIQPLRDQGYKMILWDVMPEDYNPRVKPHECCECVLRYATSGSIITFHDSMKARMNLYFALPRVLKHFTEMGFKFARLE